ncbi:hypothetical protein GXW74_00995 [Roseomonas eburnea]|uniref:O-antigen ligase domain-containing protein n=1 Tax=Neoroseomonas eburnea TaxID=1346889 RepID=A0A9X9X5R3_9PROT|nr:hypothetical protein [Neoroseomonas eburnea]MBR0679049.1 hypothetical protein [Neoroseomonas eburnea]
MSATLVGLTVLALCLRWAGDAGRLIQLVLVAGIFEAAAAFILGGFGLQPGLVPAAMLVALVGAQYLTGRRSVAELPTLYLMAPLLLLFAYAAVTAVLLPDAFAGRIIVWPQKFRGPIPEPLPLAPGQGNTNQVLYLAANVALACGTALALGRAGAVWNAVVRAYLFGGYLAVGIAAWEFASRTVGVPYPKELLQSNPSWGIVEQSLGSLPRLQSSFAEPSAFAFYLVGVAFACVALCLRGHRVMRADVLLVLVLVTAFLCTSTTGIAALVLGLPALLGSAALRGRKVELRRLLRRLALPGVAFVVLAAGLLAMRPQLLDVVEQVVVMTLNKGESESYAERGAMNQAAWSAFLESGGLGIGWGSTRASSAVPGLLSGAGVLGAIATVWFVARLRRAARLARATAPADHPARVVVDAFGAALAGQLLAALLSAPMITTPIFFAQIGAMTAAVIRMRLDTAARRRVAAQGAVPPGYMEPGLISGR